MGYDRSGNFKYEKGKKYSGATMNRFDNKSVKNGVNVNAWLINGYGELITIQAFQQADSKTSYDSSNNKSNDEWVSLIFECVNTETFVTKLVPAVYNISEGTAHLRSLRLHIKTSRNGGWCGKLKGKYAQEFYKNSAKGRKS